MSNWKCWPDPINANFANIEHSDRILYPNLNDGSPIVMASDYSGEHATPEFRILSFLVTTYKSVAQWELLRSEVRGKYLADGRRMSFKKLNEALRIRAFPDFLRAASQLNGVLLCVAVEKGFALVTDGLPKWEHNWKTDVLNKLIEICVFGGALVDGLRNKNQMLHWITDDDSIVSNERAKNDAANTMGRLIHKYTGEFLEVGLGIASQFDDENRAEDLVAIPDLAGGAFSELLLTIGKTNLSKSSIGRQNSSAILQVKSSLINAWRHNRDFPLKHLNAVVRPAESGRMQLSLCGLIPPLATTDDSFELDPKWKKALEADLKERGIIE